MAKSKKNFVEKRSKYLIIAAVAIVALIGGTYAWLTYTQTGTKTNVIKAGTLTLTLDDEASTGINVQNAVPMTDDQGMAQDDEYTFSVKNTGDIAAVYTLYLDNDTVAEGTELIDDAQLRYVIKSATLANDATLGDELTNATGTAQTLTSRVIASAEIAAGNTDYYSLKMWINENATGDDVSGKTFAGKIRIEASQTGIPEGTNVDYSTGQTITQ